MTDHNHFKKELWPEFRRKSTIVGIVDHHFDENKHNLTDSEKMIDDTVGSACTLVTEKLLQCIESEQIPNDLGVLLLATILCDTRNFNEKAKRFNERDIAIMEKFKTTKGLNFLPEKYIQSTDDDDDVPVEGFDQFYADLIHARFDVSHFSPHDLLRLDYKASSIKTTANSTVTMSLGCSVVFSSLTEFKKNAGSNEEIIKSCQKLGKFIKK